MTHDDIKKLALANGFKLKPQPDGTEDLNHYVYEFAAALEVECRRGHIVEGYRMLKYSLEAVPLPAMSESQRVAVEGFREALFGIIDGAITHLHAKPRGGAQH